MHLKQFRIKMKKNIFSKEEAQIVAFDTPPSTLKLQLHQWVKAGDLITLKRGLYAFSNTRVDKVEVARRLYPPSYSSLEYALNLYGFIPEKEKALRDYLYLNGRYFVPQTDFWRELRLQNLTDIDFNKAFEYAEKFGSRKLITLLRSVKEYASLNQPG